MEGKKSTQSQMTAEHWGMGWAWMSFGNKFLIFLPWPDWLLWMLCPKSHPSPLGLIPLLSTFDLE